MNDISETENLDVLLVLASAFEATISESTPQTLAVLVQKSFSAMPRTEFEALQSRANFLDKLPSEKRELWREICLEKLLRKSTRLDENINPVHIANVLSREPKSIQKHILRNLPSDLGERIAQYLGIQIETLSEKNPIIQEDIAELIRHEFLSNYISLEDIYEPTEIDRLSITELADFVHHLALREVAVACRGIASKETLAAFLNSFAPEDTQEIIRYLTELENIKPFWVVQADELVRQIWETDSNPQQVLAKIGLKLLAIAFINRDETARKYTQQKLSGKEGLKWKRMLQKTDKEFSTNNETKSRMEKRRKTVEKSTIRFIQTGRL